MEDGRDARPPTDSEASKPPNLRHFRVFDVFRTAGLENYKKGGWHGAQDDLSWQAQNLGSGGGTQICELSSIAARWRYLGPGQKPDVTRWQISFRSLASCYLISSHS